MQARLVRYENGELAEQYLLAGSKNTVGRDLGNLVQISHPKISKTHAVIHTKSGGWTVEDAASSNGVFLNSTQITGAKKLSNGDRVAFGPVEYEFECGSGQDWNAAIPIDASPDASAMTMPGVLPGAKPAKPAKKGLLGWLKLG
jgi:pSer/pThr/pTyr-binding forkhead associated (FHA) protein